MTNPNYGIFDIETFHDPDESYSNGIEHNKDNYSRVYALGFVTTGGLKQSPISTADSTDLTLYYLTDH